MKLLCLDFETKDPYIGLGLGAGWPYALQDDIPNPLFKVIGFSTLWIKDGVLGPAGYLDINEFNLSALKYALASCDGVVFHHAQYDLGCLLTLGINIKDLVVYDTKLIANLYNNNSNSFSLDPLSKEYLPSQQQKGINILLNAAIKHQLCEDLLPKRYNKGCNWDINNPADSLTKRAYSDIKQWCYSNMDVIQEYSFSAMSEYACLDVVATANLFIKFVEVENV